MNDGQLEGAAKSAEWRVVRLERAVGELDGSKCIASTVAECAERQKRLLRCAPELEAFWAQHRDFEAALRAQNAGAAVAAAAKAAQDAESGCGGAEELRQELEGRCWAMPVESSAVYSAPACRERLAKAAAVAQAQERQAARLRERILALVGASTRLVESASTQLLTADALLADSSSSSSSGNSSTRQ